MKRYLSFVALALVSLLFALSCQKETPQSGPGPEPTPQPEPQPLTESHTLMIIMQGNNGLAEFMDSNLQRIITAYYDVPTEIGRIIIFYDRGNYTRLTELYLDDGMAKQRLIEEYPTSTSTVDKEFLKSIISRMKEEAPADSYGLIMSSHGGGWVPADLYDVYLLGEDSRAAAPTARPLFYGQDDFDCMEIPDLVDALDDIRFKYIIFDACLMANIEGLYDMRNTADYIIASPTEILGAGFPYEDFIPMLFERTDHKLKEVCEAYMDYYRDSAGTVALIDCKKIDALAEVMKNVYDDAESATLNVADVQAYDNFPYHLYFDLGHYVEKVASDKNREAFNQALAEAVIYSDHTETFFTVTGPDDAYIPITHYSGLSCYIPQEESPNTVAAWNDTAWAEATK